MSNNRTKNNLKTSAYGLILITIFFFSTLLLTFPLDNGINTHYVKDGSDNENPGSINTIPDVADSTYVEWWNFNWNYRLPINITATGGNLNDYQVKININLTEWMTNGYIDPTGKDLRIVNASNDELEFYLEELGVSGANSTIWVRIPNLVDDVASIIYLYFGNANAMTKSSADQTFDFYDGFMGSAIDTNKWWIEDPTGFSVNGGELKGAHTSGKLTTKNTFSTGVRLEMKVRLVTRPGNGYQLGGFWLSTSNSFGYLWHSGSDYYRNDGGWIQIGASVPTGNHILQIDAMPSSQVYYNLYNYQTGLSQKSGTVSNVVSTEPISLGRRYDNGLYNQIYEGYWDWIRVRRYSSVEPSVLIGELENAKIKVICVDIDGFRVPNAHVSITNDSQPTLDQNLYTDTNGEIDFYNIPTGIYNITVNYTQNIDGGQTETVAFLENYVRTENELVIPLELWTINFTIKDYDGDPFKYGYVELYDISDLVGNVSLDDQGMATIRWLNQTEYDYMVYFDPSQLADGSTYDFSRLLVADGTVTRSSADSPNIKQIAQRPFTSMELTPLEIDNQVKAEVTFSPQSAGHISEFNISVEGVQDTIRRLYVFVQYPGESFTLFESRDFGVVTIEDYAVDYNFGYNTTYPTNVKAVKLVLYKQNIGADNGTIGLKYINSTNIDINLNFSKVTFNVTDQEALPLQNALVRIHNKTLTPTEGNLVASLKVDAEGFATYYGLNNETLWGNHTTLIRFGGINRDFLKDGIGPLPYLNISFDRESLISMEVILNVEDFRTELNLTSQNPANFLTQVYWGDNFSVIFNFTTQEYIGAVWDIDLATPTTISLQILDSGFNPLNINIDLLPYETSTGKFTVELNTTEIHLEGIEGYSYYIYISAEKSGYMNPDSILKPLQVRPLQTSIQFHDYDDMPNILTEKTVYYNETTNITVSYYNTTLISGASLSYSWTWGAGTNIGEDPMLDPGFYTFTIDTSLSDDVKTFTITVTMQLQNHTSKTGYITLQILPRPTQINGTVDLPPIVKSVWLKDAHNFTFEYTDMLTSDIIQGADVATYSWYRFGSDGSYLIGDGLLIERTTDNLYVLDFDTETREVGEYIITVSLYKNLHEERKASVFLSVKQREIASLLSTNFDLVDRKIEVIKGETITFELQLTDPTKGDIPLAGATVILTLGETAFEFEETEVGKYTLTLPTLDYEAVYTAQTLTGQITIEKEDYTTVEVEITIVVNMEEIFPGMPLFYFIMIVGSITAIVISLVTYKAIQNAKIPAYVKLIDKTSKNINGKKEISPQNIAKSEKQQYLGMFEERWKLLGLNLAEIIGLNKDKAQTDWNIAPGDEDGGES